LKTSKVKNYFLNTLLTIALCCAACFLDGLLGNLIWILISALLGVVLYRYHFTLGILNCGLVIAVFSLFFNVINGLICAVPLILLGISLALGTRFKVNTYYLILISAVLFLLNTMFSMELLRISSGGATTLNSLLLDAGQQLREAAMQMEPEAYAAFEEGISMTIGIITMLSPAIFVTISIVLAYILIAIYKKIQTAQGVDMSFLCPFEKLQAEKSFSVFYIVLLLLLTFVPGGIVFDAVVNVLLILSVIFLGLGLSVFTFKLKHEKSDNQSRRLLIIMLIACSTAFFIVPLFGMILCGLLDSFFDYRKLRPQTDYEDS